MAKCTLEKVEERFYEIFSEKAAALSEANGESTNKATWKALISGKSRTTGEVIPNGLFKTGLFLADIEKNMKRVGIW